jgi:nicotinate-nucleotide--dimethylbenzimidazole phosphoribosyltransferase
MVARVVTGSEGQTVENLHAQLMRVIADVRPADTLSVERARDRLDHLTKPRGSLGRLEEIAARVCGIQATTRPSAAKRLVLICAGDHGVTVEGVSAYPSAVTPQMVANFVRGGAAINAIARSVGANVWVVDVGVAGSIPDSGEAAQLIARRVRNGTRNMRHEPAMSEFEMLQAIAVGIELATRAADEGVELLGLGEMGIGNTTAASAITAALTGLSPRDVTGRGTGVDEATLSWKVDVIEQTLALHRPRADHAFDVLQTVGGFEIAALCGAYVGAAARRLVVIADGFIATAAALVAVALCPLVAEYLFAGHLSPEPGHAIQLEQLRARPLLQLDMRLGEGTGAALAMSLIGAACAAFNEMATFESAGVSEGRC